MYRLYFPLMAIGRALAAKGIRVQESAVAGAMRTGSGTPAYAR
jgi:hypothetical protein